MKIISQSIHSFDELYNGHKIPNPTGNYKAKYYILRLDNGTVFLQNHRPFVQGYEAITDDNVEEIMNEHIKSLEENNTPLNTPLNTSIEKPV